MRIPRRLGHYTLLELLGEGAMGAVWKARDDRTQALVALKLVKVETDPESLARFEREATAAAAIRHEGVTSVLDVGVEDGVPFIAFEVIPGGSLKARLQRSGRLPWREAVGLAREIALGLGAIHAVGLVHRDLKPENVLLDATGRTKLSDFGLARQVGSRSDLTRTGEIVGTPSYMAPEQAIGLKMIDARADLYALGVLLFELLTGEVPFKGHTLTVLKAHMTEAPPTLRSRGVVVPAELDALVRALLAKAPDERPASVDAVVRCLDAALAKGGGARGVRAVVGLAALVSLVAVVVAVAGRGRGSPGDPVSVASEESIASASSGTSVSPRAREPRSSSPPAAASSPRSPDPAAGARREARACYLRAREHVQDFSGATFLDDVNRAIALDPRLLDAYRVRHLLLIIGGHQDDDRPPRDLVMRVRAEQRAPLEALLKQPPESIAWDQVSRLTEKAILADCCASWAWTSLAEIRWHEHDTEAALTEVNYAVSLDDSDPRPHWLAANYLLETEPEISLGLAIRHLSDAATGAANANPPDPEFRRAIDVRLEAARRREEEIAREKK